MRKYRLLPAVALALFLMTLAACTATKPVANPKLVVLGHAGSGFYTPISPFNYRPPSSWRGIRRALLRGADGVEIDLQMSRDSVVMLYHDQKMEDGSTAAGCISQRTAAEITQARYRGGFPYDLIQKERPISFDTLLARLNRWPSFPYIHLDLHEDDQCLPAGHQHDRTPLLVRQIARSLARYHVPPAKVLFITQEGPTITLARAAMPGVRVGLEIASDEFAFGLKVAKTERVHTVVLDADRVTPEQSAQAHAAGLTVVVFGGRSPKDLRRVLATQPDEIEVDNVKRLLQMQGRGQK
ncbi:glycerophosphodiester phosphodiesterase [Hymenobacter convexus]|uniref:glycerophosphodiester phosphodiesterase n=1 Tax=Hymenobacter sp. CA1UV-4 TaxID=3063782 RepID=UPI002713081D|nr:glycerophosphodiester phosphodiesterase family protein [Hymenobacter sp. CA1UV-4]MDO7852237.1 glycerophosphodiester phosphodiesterase family protein [Hymenobacter sp. CA1UV-4]